MTADEGSAPARLRGRAALLIGGALVLTGCPTAPPPSQFPNGAAALARMQETYSCANGIQGEGKIDHFSDKGRVRGDVAIFAINPARVRVDVISSFGAMLYTLTSNGSQFKMLDTQEKQFLHGPAKPCNLARLTQVPVPGHVLVWLLRGEAPLLVHEPDAPTIDWQDDHYRVLVPSTRGANQEIDLEVHPDDWLLPYNQQRLRVMRVETRQQGLTLYRATLEDHELTRTAPARVDPEGIDDDIPPSGGACEVEIPRRIQMVVPHTGDDVVFEYQKVHFNPPIPEGAFTQPVPGGVRVQQVDCQD